MDVSEVRVLAKRANKLLYVSAVLMLLNGFAFVYSLLIITEKIEPHRELFELIYVFNLFAGRRRFRHFDLYYDYDPEFLAFECALSYGFVLAVLFFIFIRRLSIPKIIIEYDDFGLYVYRKGQPVTLIRYEDLCSVYIHEEMVDEYEDFDSSASVKATNKFAGISSGAIRFETLDGFIVASGIKDVRNVEREIQRMLKKKRMELISDLEKNKIENNVF